ncbi:calcium-binding protein [Streptomyces pinistramenti]|uniref:calcium-binding protein n=1 Tax=Streptomyces pinistramenti TaxID=2884812 RepID=UPI001D08B49A|nr:calcium-binding protein [Streptomyces pinistramenti]MCB5909852.1 calcium-binding protein [Streptomyces pinistramenti]
MPAPLVGRRVLRVATALTLALAAGVAAPAARATTAGAAPPQATAAVSDNGRELSYTAAAGQTNKVSVTESFASGSKDRLTYVIDDVVPVGAGPGCGYPDGADRTKVSCTVTTVESQDPYAALDLDVGDGEDTVTVDNTTGQTYYFNRIRLGAGKDRLTDTGPVDGAAVLGGAGDDTISVGEAATVLAGDGDDTVYAVGEATAVEGGAGDDVIHGGPGDQPLSGDDGNDTVYGGKGDDLLYGGAGDDVMYGNSGDDQLYGGPGKDTLSGGPGTDVVQQD